MVISESVRYKALISMAVIPVVVLAVGCSTDPPASDGDDASSPKTPAGVFEAQSDLYGALFEDPPDFESASVLMSADCLEEWSDAEDVVRVVLAEVEVAQSGNLSEESVLSIFSEIAYTITEDVASGDDGSEWLYEDGGWRSTDCQE